MHWGRAGLWSAVAVGLVVACSSSSDNGPSNISLSGVVRDYFTNSTLASAQLDVDGLALQATSGAAGDYSFPDVPTDAALSITGSLANYSDTRNPAIQTHSSDLVRGLALVSTTDVNRQYTVLGTARTAGDGTLFVELADAQGQPLEGIPVTDISLVDQGSNPAGAGPYVFGTGGDLDPSLTMTTAFLNRSRVAFVNVPPGNYTIGVRVSPALLVTLGLVMSADGVTLVAP
jgi:hypothetical protein